MQRITKKNQKLWESISSLLFFSLSDKLKFSIKVSLSIVLAYLIPFSQGWEQAHVAAITIIIIAASGPVSSSIYVGTMRLIGVLIGAIIGMTLIALFPQDRLFYLLALSVTVTITLYMLRAFKGDTSIFMLTAMTMMLVFKNGEVDDIFIYGIDRTYMTALGVLIYTFVGVFLWPVNLKDNNEEYAQALSSLQLKLFLNRDATEEERISLKSQLLKQEQLLDSATMDNSTASMNMRQWNSMIHNYKNINELLTLLSIHDKESYTNDLELYVSDYTTLESAVSSLLENIRNEWKEKNEIHIPEHIKPVYIMEKIKTLSHLENASLLTTIQNMKKLHDELITLAKKLNSLNSPMPTLFSLENIPEKKHFLWGDIEDIKGSLITFIIFWSATVFWITANPPGGFIVVVAATGLGVLTSFSPLKPIMLIIIFTLSFIFSTLMYVFVLPNLHYGWELGLFIFIYMFIAFHFISPKMSIFFALGMVLMIISNEMYYDFSFFLLLLLVFYLFLFFLQFFYYIPFSNKPEHLFLTLKKRFFKLSYLMLERVRDKDKSSILLKLGAKYSDMHLMKTVKKMQLWASKIDTSYFDTIDKNTLLAFTQECEKFTYMLKLLYHRDMRMHKNPLIKETLTHNDLPSLSILLKEYYLEKEVKEVDSFWKDEKVIPDKAEEYLTKVLSTIDFSAYSEEIISEFYENISLRKNVWLSFFACQEMMETLDFKVLQRNRF
ncbi:MAG: hypothetical protein DRQ78_04860 [Epsilonproteobacteria bacterium]|nr:MAG: hypothetical protein DRQ78_04860 [Campylobacterota bacterium]